MPFLSGREDLNLRPSAPEADALPGCATPRFSIHAERAAFYASFNRMSMNFLEVNAHTKLIINRGAELFSKVNTITRQEAGGGSLPNTLPNLYSEITQFPYKALTVA